MSKSKDLGYFEWKGGLDIPDLGLDIPKWDIELPEWDAILTDWELEFINRSQHP